ncbi:hypothetical protein D6783_00800, partial [Candidatus Woesearchaeota archaeon]
MQALSVPSRVSRVVFLLVVWLALCTLGIGARAALVGAAVPSPAGVSGADASVSRASSVSLDKEVFVLGEQVAFFVQGSASDRLSVVTPSSEFRFLGDPNGWQTFIPQEAGEYVVVVRDVRGASVAQASFQVVEELTPKEGEAGTVQTDKEVYLPGELVRIKSLVKGFKTRLTLRTPSSTYTFLGDVDGEVKFRPQEVGTYTVTLTDELEGVSYTTTFEVSLEVSRSSSASAASATQGVFNRSGSGTLQGGDAVLNTSSTLNTLNTSTNTSSGLSGSRASASGGAGFDSFGNASNASILNSSIDRLGSALGAGRVEGGGVVSGSNGVTLPGGVQGSLRVQPRVLLRDRSGRVKEGITRFLRRGVPQEVVLENNRYDVEIVEVGGVRIFLHNVTAAKELVLDFEEVRKKRLGGLKDVPIESFAINPAELNFTNGTITRTAKGNKLYKCADWSFAAQECKGSWQLVQALEPGKPYVIPIYAGDPGFAETLEILNVQSYPTVGGVWEVRFNTTGTADLVIAPADGTTWDNVRETEDLKFLTLSCGGEAVNYTWEAGRVVARNYSCNETGREASKVLTRGTHTLAFTFGNVTKYAHNFALVSGVLMLRESAGGLNLNTVSGASVTFDSVDRNDSQYLFTPGSSIVTVNESGIYRVSYGVGFTRPASNTRVEHFAKVTVNGADANACWSQTYTRGSTDSLEGVATADCLLNLSAGDNVSIVAGRSSSSSAAATVWGNHTWLHMQFLHAPDVAMIRDSVGGDSMDSTTGVVIDWNVAERVDSSFNFTPTSTNVTILKTGLYRVSYGIAIHEAGGGIRYGGDVRLLVNGNTVPVGASYTYVRGDTSSEDGVATSDALIELSAGDVIQVRGRRESSASAAVSVFGGRTWLDVERVPDGDANVAILHDLAGGQSVNTVTGTDINFATVNRSDSHFIIVDSNTVEVNHTGLYRVSYNVYENRSSGSTRLELFGVLRLNGADAPVCASQGYNRGAQGSEDTYESSNFASCLVQLSQGDRLEVRVGRSSSSSATITTAGGRTYWSLQSVDALREPSVVLNTPANASVVGAHVDFNFTATDDQVMTCTLYGNFSGSWGP